MTTLEPELVSDRVPYSVRSEPAIGLESTTRPASDPLMTPISTQTPGDGSDSLNMEARVDGASFRKDPRPAIIRTTLTSSFGGDEVRGPTVDHFPINIDELKSDQDRLGPAVTGLESIENVARKISSSRVVPGVSAVRH